jgi:hypothetical protein
MAGYGPENVAALSTGVGDIFAGFGSLEKAQGAAVEAAAYRQAAQFAGEEASWNGTAVWNFAKRCSPRVLAQSATPIPRIFC